MLPSSATLHTMLPSPFDAPDDVARRCRRSRRCCRRRSTLQTMLPSSLTLQTMLPSSFDAPDDVVVVLARAPHDGLSGLRLQRAPRLVRCPGVAAGQRHAAGDQVVAPDDVTGPVDALVVDGVAHLTDAVLRRGEEPARGARRPCAFRKPAPCASTFSPRATRRCTAGCAFTALGVSVGFASSINATVPATTGVAMLVPLRLRYGL